MAKTRDNRYARTMRVVENRAKRGSWIALNAACGLRIATAIAARTTIPARIRSRPRRPRISPAKDGGYIRVVESVSDASEEPRKDRLLRVQTVLRLIEGDGPRAVHHLVRDFKTAMRREAMHHDRVTLRMVEELRIDLEGPEHFLALLFLFFLAHRDPDVGVHDIGSLHGDDGIGDDVNLGSAVLRDAPRRREDFGVGLVTARAGRRDVHADNRGAEEERIAYVIAVPDVREFQLLERAPVLQDREEIRDALAGVLLVIEAVDHRHARILREFDDVLSPERPIHDAVHIAAQDSRGVGDRLSPSDLQIVRAQEEVVAAELRHADLKRHPRPGRSLFENHRQALTAERLVRLPRLRAGLDACRALAETHQIGLHAENRDEIALRAHGPPDHPTIRTKTLCILRRRRHQISSLE